MNRLIANLLMAQKLAREKPLEPYTASFSHAAAIIKPACHHPGIRSRRVDIEKRRSGSVFASVHPCRRGNRRPASLLVIGLLIYDLLGA